MSLMRNISKERKQLEKSGFDEESIHVHNTKTIGTFQQPSADCKVHCINVVKEVIHFWWKASSWTNVMYPINHQRHERYRRTTLHESTK